MDLFEIILIQVKSGSAMRPLSGDIHRLKGVQARYDAQEIVLFEWAKKKDKKKGIAQFSKLDYRGGWEETTAAKLFGKPNRLGQKGIAKSASKSKPAAPPERRVMRDAATKARATRRAASAADGTLPKVETVTRVGFAASCVAVDGRDYWTYGGLTRSTSLWRKR